MSIRKYKCINSSTRYKSVNAFDSLSPDNSSVIKSLMKGKKKISGRGNLGRISVRRRGGGVKRKYRFVSFVTGDKKVGKVKAIHYDPNRSSFLSLVSYLNGDYGYILHADKVLVGDVVHFGSGSPIKNGNTLPLAEIPVGTNVYNVEMSIGRGGIIARSAGSFCTITAKDDGYVFLKMPSSEIRKVRRECFATIGMCGNREHNLISIGKAGKTRWLGRRPKVRGVVMNPIDHPHGGGEGKSSGGRHPVSPWGKPTKGYKTRKKVSQSDKFIVSRRK